MYELLQLGSQISQLVGFDYWLILHSKGLLAKWLPRLDDRPDVAGSVLQTVL